MSVRQKYSGDATESQRVYVGYYLSKDRQWSSDDRYLGYDVSTVYNNDPHDDESATLQIPSDIAKGDYYILFVADYKKQYDETNENDNVAYVGVTVGDSGEGAGDGQAPGGDTGGNGNSDQNNSSGDGHGGTSGGGAPGGDTGGNLATLYTWNEASQICADQGKRLPTIYELRYALQTKETPDIIIENDDENKRYWSATQSDSNATNYYFVYGNAASQWARTNPDTLLRFYCVDESLDSDNDGVADLSDNFPFDANESADTDGDGIGNNADTDDDNDGISDADELKYGFNPKDPSDATQDSDGDGVNNIDEIKAGTDPRTSDLVLSLVSLDDLNVTENEEIAPITIKANISNNTPITYQAESNNTLLAVVSMDDNLLSITLLEDMTGVAEINVTVSAGGLSSQTHFVLTVARMDDQDGDGIEDSQDADIDGDGIGNAEDAFPLDASESVDTDGDGTGNNADTDDDNDGLSDTKEAELGTDPLLADTDDDGVSDSQDAFPLDPSRSERSGDGGEQSEDGNITGGGGGCSYNPNAKGFDLMMLLMLMGALLYPLRHRYSKER